MFLGPSIVKDLFTNTLKCYVIMQFRGTCGARFTLLKYFALLRNEICQIFSFKTIVGKHFRTKLLLPFGCLRVYSRVFFLVILLEKSLNNVLV